MEVAMANNQQVGAILWDFTKLLDMMLLPLLVAAAIRLHFPVADLILGLEMHSAPRWLGMMGCVGGLIQPHQVCPPWLHLVHPLHQGVHHGEVPGAGGPTPRGEV